MARAEVIPPALNTIVLNDDEEEVPPPPPLFLPEEACQGEEQIPPPPAVQACEISPEDDDIVETPSPPEWDARSFSLDDLNLQLEDLSDPFIQDFVRSVCGATNTMVDIRPPTPPSPSPPSSPSSIDWENENFRPPTPPRRRLFGTFDVEDNQYAYLGMHCYERVWRARVLVPRMRSAPALLESTQSRHQSLEAGIDSPPWPPRQQNTSGQAVPITPGRGWLNHRVYNNGRPTSPEEYPPPPQCQTPPPPHCQTPPLPHCQIPPPPHCQTPPPHCQLSPPRVTPATAQMSATAIQNPMVTQLPLLLQEEIEARKQKYKGTRTRFTYSIHDQQYRITISRSGDVRVTRI